MDIYIVIPAHNEAAFIIHTLESISQQSFRPKKVVVVNDHSTDQTETLVSTYITKHSYMFLRQHESSSLHLPGSKVVQAFNCGLKSLDNHYDLILKLDADIVLPKNYLEKIALHFKNDPKLGICGGFAYEKNASGVWKINHPMDKNHIRGAFKAYRASCFKAIGGLRVAMGWDTADELLAQFHGYHLKTDPTLKVKHLRPTGTAYNKKAKQLQGRAMYGLRYGFIITLIAAFKMAAKQQKPLAFFYHLGGYLNAQQQSAPFLVNKKEGAFIRQLRWQNIRKKIQL